MAIRSRHLLGLATSGLIGLAIYAYGQAQDRTAADQPPSGRIEDYPRDHAGPGGPVGTPGDRGRLVPGLRAPGQPPVPVEGPDLAKLPWKLVNGAKEFHLIAEPVKRELLPDMKMDLWCFNGSLPGPIIEATEGDRVRIVVHNKLPEPTVIHWHGLELPNRFDGVPGVTQDPIMPGKEFVYEFDLHQNGTFFYHSHAPMQEAMGMFGPFIIHPKVAHDPPVDRDFVVTMQEFAILPQNTIPNSMSMEFDFMTINGCSGPTTTPMVVKLGERVRIRFINFSVINAHPMHLHGHTFWVTGTEGGRIPPTAWIPSNNVLVAVAQARDVEFVANNPGDWMLHCHILHHMMNHMTSMVRMPDMTGARGMGRMAGPGGMETGMGMLQQGPALAPENGPALGRGTGEQTSTERRMGTGMQSGGMPMDERFRVPGFPQDMMDMKAMNMAKMAPTLAAKKETQGMRRNWFTGVEAMMTTVRVLPPPLFDRVMRGDRDIPPGASVPGASPGKVPMKHENMKHGGH